MNRLINLLLLVVMFFSITHGVVLADYAESDCSIHEYIAEFSTPHLHEDIHEDEGDACSTHYMFHISFLLPESFQLSSRKLLTSVEIHEAKDNSSLFENNTFRPPIA